MLRHSTAHATAQAVQELFPGTKIGQGPVIENGFYYDFDRERALQRATDLGAIEERVREIIERDLPIERVDLPRDEALAFFRKEDEPYKLYFADDQGRRHRLDLPPGRVERFLSRTARPIHRMSAQLQAAVRGRRLLAGRREEEDAPAHLRHRVLLARRSWTNISSDARRGQRKRDHRKLGTELGLFSFHPESPASPFFHPSAARPSTTC